MDLKHVHLSNCRALRASCCVAARKRKGSAMMIALHLLIACELTSVHDPAVLDHRVDQIEPKM